MHNAEQKSNMQTWLVLWQRLTSDMCMQDVQRGLQSTRASQSYIQGLFRQQQPIKPACETKMEDPNGTWSLPKVVPQAYKCFEFAVTSCLNHRSSMAAVLLWQVCNVASVLGEGTLWHHLHMNS